MGNFDFDKEFEKTSRQVSFIRKIVFGGMFVFFLVVLILGGWLIINLHSQDWSGGIQPVIESLWCGSPGCLSR